MKVEIKKRLSHPNDLLMHMSGPPEMNAEVTLEP
jgi:Na+-transporting NADH:ubiquinone oxidoreductase subunit NqrF